MEATETFRCVLPCGLEWVVVVCAFVVVVSGGGAFGAMVAFGRDWIVFHAGFIKVDPSDDPRQSHRTHLRQDSRCPLPIRKTS